MQSILDAINEWIKEILIGAINGNLSTMFGDVNEKVGTIAAEVGRTPQAWNANVFSMIRTLSENVVVPIAGLVITYVLCYELISMVTEKNNMHDIETFMFFKWIFKAFVAVFIVTNTFNITMAVFDMAQHIVSGAAGVIGGDTNIDVAEALAAMQEGLEDMEIPELLLLVLETSLVSLCMKIMSVLITVILYGRMIEIYLYCSVSPIPFATMTNREWGQIGNNYLKGLFALGFQGFLIMICVGIYAVLVNDMIIADNLHSAVFSLAAYSTRRASCSPFPLTGLPRRGCLQRTLSPRPLSVLARADISAWVRKSARRASLKSLRRNSTTVCLPTYWTWKRV